MASPSDGTVGRDTEALDAAAFDLEPSSAESAPEGSQDSPEEPPVESGAGLREPAREPRDAHPVRAKLLARAALAKRGAAGPATPEDALEIERELFERGGLRPVQHVSLARRRSELSPSAVALFGTLLGLAAVASLTALAVGLSARKAQEPTPGPTASQLPAASPSRPPELRPPRQKIPGPWRVADAAREPGLAILEGTIGKKAFLRAIQDAGLEKSQAYRVLTVLKGLRDLEKCGATDRFMAAIDSSSRRVKAFEYIVRPEEVLQAREGADGLLHARALDLKVERSQVRGVVVARGGFAESAARAGFEPGLADAVRGAIEGHFRLDDLEHGDVLRIVAQEVTVLGEFTRYAGVEALEYRPRSGSEPLRLYYLETPALKGHYDARGRAPYEGGWRIPVEGARVTSKFNPRRLHPILKKVKPHTGTDFGADTGTPVGASSYGTVSFIGWAGVSGNLVKVQHPGNIETGYAHLSRFAEGLAVGDKVKRLELVGYVGTTGRSTAPHLHFSAKRDGKFIDPESLKLNALRVLPAADRPVFEQVKARYDKLLDAIELPAPEPATATAIADAAPKLEDPVGDEGMEPAFHDTPADTNAHLAASAPALASEPAGLGVSKPAEPAGASKPAAAATAEAAGPALYLSDEELLKLQSRTDDGEVE